MRKINLNISVAVCVLMMTLAGPAGAVTHYVFEGQSIQAAIDDANDGDEIQVEPGTYYEAIDFTGKAVRLYSSGGPEVTTIDANGAYHVVQCISGEDSNTVMEGFTITGGNANSSTGSNSYGGGMYNRDSSPTVNNCIFITNKAYNGGGGMYNWDNSSPKVTNCMFSSNTVIRGKGGGMHSSGSNPTVINCTFIGNSSDLIWGGGMYNEYNSPSVINCTFSGNTSVGGGGMCNSGSSPTVTNCIFWGDWPDEILNLPPSTPNVTYSDVQGGYSGTGNIDANPRFGDATGGDLRLSSSGSPCVDSGDNSVPGLPATDLAGNPRVVDGNYDGTAVVDMGSFEFKSRRLIHNITRDHWYEAIQTCINYAIDGDEIEVGPGSYNESVNFKRKAIRLYSSGGTDVTTIDANGIAGAYHVVQCVSGEGPSTVLEGFTITGGNANGLVYPDDCGGGMYNKYSSPTVTNCIFTGNAAIYGGGGMYNEDSNPKVTNCVFIGNTTTGAGGGMGNEYDSYPSVTDCNFINNTANQGGGMYNYESDPSVNNCTFSDNTANDGSGMYNYNSRPTVTNCMFSGNEAENGGGMLNERSNPTVTNCTFSVNEASNGGGMLNQSDSNPTVTNCRFNENEANKGGGMLNQSRSRPIVTNCIFSGNTAGNSGGGMYNHDSQLSLRNCTLTDNTAFIGGGMLNRRSGSTLTNCILWGDTPDEIFDIEITAWLYYCDIQGGWIGQGGDNIDADPLFVDANNPDPNLRSLRLKPDSPCIDAGDSTIPLDVPIYFDLDGKHRYVDIDSVDDTGYGPLDFLDIGAYEFNCNYTAGDSNCDGLVNFKDLAILAANWLAGTEPEL